jgi:hypothetical protein
MGVGSGVFFDVYATDPNGAIRFLSQGSFLSQSRFKSNGRLKRRVRDSGGRSERFCK